MTDPDTLTDSPRIDRPYLHWDLPTIEGQIQACQVSVMCLAMANAEQSDEYLRSLEMLRSLRAERNLRTA